MICRLRRELEFWGWESGGPSGEPGDVEVGQGELAFVPQDVVSSAEQDEVPQPRIVIPTQTETSRC